MINFLMAQEAIASTEIEIGPFTEVERMAMLIVMTSNGLWDMKAATALAEKIINEQD